VSVIADGVGLNITAMSYRDHIDFGIIADRDMVGDAWPLLRGVQSACDELKEVVCGPRVQPEPVSAEPEAEPEPLEQQ